MSYEITAKLIEKQPIQQVSDKFKKLEFILEYKEKPESTFTETLKFQLVNDKCNLLDNVPEGSEIKVAFNLRGRKWEKDGKTSYFNSFDAWKIELLSAGTQQTTHVPNPHFVQPELPVSNDLPF